MKNIELKIQMWNSGSMWGEKGEEPSRPTPPHAIALLEIVLGPLCFYKIWMKWTITSNRFSDLLEGWARVFLWAILKASFGVFTYAPKYWDSRWEPYIIRHLRSLCKYTIVDCSPHTGPPWARCHLSGRALTLIRVYLVLGTLGIMAWVENITHYTVRL